MSTGVAASLTSIRKRAASALFQFADGWQSTHVPITIGHLALALLYVLQAFTLFPYGEAFRIVAFVLFLIAAVIYLVLALVHARGYQNVQTFITELRNEVTALEEKHGPPTSPGDYERRNVSLPPPPLVVPKGPLASYRLHNE